MNSSGNRKILLEDGQEFYGSAFGSREDRVCEIVFNTSMVGYQEILSDLSYADQAVVMTYPLIGNYGTAEEDYESEIPAIGALIVRSYNDEPSNFRSRWSLGQVMEEHGIVGISGVDTRALARSIRDYGTRKALLTDAGTPIEKGLEILRNTKLRQDAVSRVSCKNRTVYYAFSNEELFSGMPGERFASDRQGAPRGIQDNRRMERSAFGGTGSFSGERSSFGGKGSFLGGRFASGGEGSISGGRHVVAIDCGMKKNIVRSLYRQGCMVTVVPWNTTAREIRSLHPDGILISNGPGDPTDVPETVGAVRALLGSYPVFGICLGHQILSLAYGAETYKLKFGHRGGNHPVKNLQMGRIEITSQNHSYAIDEESLQKTPLEVTHVNLLDRTIEGVACARDGAFGVQYHPESAPGPRDSTYLFDRFLQTLR